MISFLLALCPKAWRRAYGEEFAALLEQTHLTPRVLVDVLAQAVKLHLEAHPVRLRIGAALVASFVIEVIARSAGLTANALWPPTTPVRAVALVALFVPWASAILSARDRRKGQPVPDSSKEEATCSSGAG